MTSTEKAGWHTQQVMCPMSVHVKAFWSRGVQSRGRESQHKRGRFEFVPTPQTRSLPLPDSLRHSSAHKDTAHSKIWIPMSRHPCAFASGLARRSRHPSLRPAYTPKELCSGRLLLGRLLSSSMIRCARSVVKTTGCGAACQVHIVIKPRSPVALIHCVYAVRCCRSTVRSRPAR